MPSHVSWLMSRCGFESVGEESKEKGEVKCFSFPSWFHTIWFYCSHTYVLFSLANYTLPFVWIERQGHSVHMSSVLQVQQLYTTGIPLLEALTCQWPIIEFAKYVSPKKKWPLATWSRFIRMHVMNLVMYWHSSWENNYESSPNLDINPFLT